MKYPILHYGRDEFGDKEDVFGDKEIVKAIILFKGQEYVFTYVDVDNTVDMLIEPSSKIIDALLNSTLFHDMTPEYSRERLLRAVQDELQVIERTGVSLCIDPEYADILKTMDKTD